MTTTVPMQAAPMAVPVAFPQQGLPPRTSSLNSKAALITGYMQIGISVTSLGFGIACIFLGFLQGYIGVPIWGGLGFYLVAGILGVVAGHSKGQNRCAVVGCLVMSILAAVTAFVHLVIGSISSAYDYYYYYGGERAVNIVCTIVGGIELVVAIVAAVYMCCGASCCCGDSPKVQYVSYVVQSGQVGQPGQVMMQQHVGQPHVMGQPQVIGQPQQNVLYMPQAQAQLPAYTEHETKGVPQV